VIALADDLPCVLFALRRESMVFRCAHRPLLRLKSAPCHAALAGGSLHSFLLMETGVGRRAVDAAFDWLLATVRCPRWLIYAGFAGALDPALCVGDVLLADAIVGPSGQCWSAQKWSGVQSGRLFTAERLVGTPTEKRELAAAHGACMVDMEAAHVASRAATAAIPFFSIRAISDNAQTSLSPAFVALLAGGRVSAPRLVRAICGRPSLLLELWRLGRDTRIAARQLARALDRLLAAHAARFEVRQDGSSGVNVDVAHVAGCS
jgi:nucleoside phosphorylase